MDGVAVVICAAGSSLRMGGVKKEYRTIDTPGHSLTVLGSVVRAFASVSQVEMMVIAVPENGETAAREALPAEYVTACKPQLFFVTGGKTRRASVFNALSLLAERNPRYVLIHDGARPWVQPQLIERIIRAVQEHNAVTPLLPLTDTPKECDAPLWETQPCSDTSDDVSPIRIQRHLKRSLVGVAQTPQAFAFPEILHAHEKAAESGREDFTDDAEVWGAFCGPVAVIPGSPDNRKITFSGDIA
ncbi:MAG: 2-C-methyl-D-erythritol 4-phosphate cytidylyltransferase [Treponema sp.]|jgi:2-C-methyl-D-erythritol 4-phosphate cytidylyltransferase|nr:2-C-methyl-D-erythritol 4-phosphate cytidylyltransferase [Treponema sp.]